MFPPSKLWRILCDEAQTILLLLLLREAGSSGLGCELLQSILPLPSTVCVSCLPCNICIGWLYIDSEHPVWLPYATSWNPQTAVIWKWNTSSTSLAESQLCILFRLDLHIFASRRENCWHTTLPNVDMNVIRLCSQLLWTDISRKKKNPLLLSSQSVLVLLLDYANKFKAYFYLNVLWFSAT